MDLSQKLSPNFSLKELIRSDTATRKGLDNIPNEEILENLKTLCKEVLQPVRDHFKKGVNVNSGYRSPEVNSSIGGSTRSDHCKGMAADIEIRGVSNHELAMWIATNLKYRQLILEFYTSGIPDSGWVHVSYNSDDLKCQELTASRENGKTVYRSGLIA